MLPTTIDLTKYGVALERLWLSATLLVFAAFGIILLLPVVVWIASLVAAVGDVQLPAAEERQQSLIAGLFYGYGFILLLVGYVTIGSYSGLAARYFDRLLIILTVGLLVLIIWSSLATRGNANVKLDLVSLLTISPSVWLLSVACALAIPSGRRLRTEWIDAAHWNVVELADLRLGNQSKEIFARGLFGLIQIVLAALIAMFAFLALLAAYWVIADLWWHSKDGTAAWPFRYSGTELVGATTALWLVLRTRSALIRRIRSDAVTALVRDGRAPVLLLRSFADDSTSIRPRRLLARLMLRKIRLEEALAAELGRLGPFIAVGRPGELLPELGAYRSFLRDDEWQETVLRWMDSSCLIIVIAGATDWVRWELENVLSRKHLGKLVIMLPPSTGEDLESRWQVLANALHRPDLLSPAIARINVLAFAPGEETDAGTLVTSSAKHEVNYQLAQRIAIENVSTRSRA